MASVPCSKEVTSLTNIIPNRLFYTLYIAQKFQLIASHSESGKRLSYLNITPDEVIRSLFYNKTNQSVITVSVFRGDFYSALKCRATPVA